MLQSDNKSSDEMDAEEEVEDDDDSVDVDPSAASACSKGSMPLVMKSLVAKQAKVHFLKGEKSESPSEELQ